MTGQYKHPTLGWRPVATVTGGDSGGGSGGGSGEKYQMDASGGSNNLAAISSVDDQVWDHVQPYASGASLEYGFYAMAGITRVPLFDTSNVTNMGYMFRGCTSLVEVPPFDTSNVTNMGYMFYDCGSLVEIPEFDMSAVTNTSNFVSTPYGQPSSLTRFKAFGAVRGFSLRGTQLDAAALNEMMGNLGTAAGTQTVDIRDTPGVSTCDTSIATAKGWTVRV